jgi:hypothetical protein
MMYRLQIGCLTSSDSRSVEMSAFGFLASAFAAAFLAFHKRAAHSTSASSTLCRPRADRLMTFKTSAVAV